MARRHAYRTYNRLYRLVANDDICVYCGVPADTLDHFVPISLVPMLGEMFGPIGKQFLVPACRECNSLAGSKIFKTIGAKRRFIQAKIRKRNKALLASPSWVEADFDGMGYVLATKIRESMVRKTWIEARLRWRNTSNKNAVSIAAISSRFGVIGSGSARPSVG